MKTGYVNLFSSMIPFSKSQLVAKIHKGNARPPQAEPFFIFSELLEKKSFIFTYIIYSKKKMKEFEEILMKNKNETAEQKLLTLLDESEPKVNYFRYLQALTSKFKFRKFVVAPSDLRELEANLGHNL